MYCQELLNKITSLCETVLGSSLTGVYLHGSLAMGCFNPLISDVDIIVIIGGDMTDGQKLLFLEQVAALNDLAPAKGIELSIVKREFCRPFVYPTPYELHFSPMHLPWLKADPVGYVSSMKGTDMDLAAHFTVINQYGVVLWGEPIENVFGNVPKSDYFDSIWHDIKDAEADISENPVYVTLNLCRVLAFLRDDLCLSKKSGGEWGLGFLPPAYHAVIANALDCYKSGQPMTADDIAKKQFARFALSEIELHKPGS